MAVKIPVIFSILLPALLAQNSSKSCRLDTHNDKQKISIKVTCEAMAGMSVKITDSQGLSQLMVYINGEELISMSHDKETLLTIAGDTLKMEDIKESKVIDEVFARKQYQVLGLGAKLIHDELQLKGWKSPAVMFLYKLGIAVTRFQNYRSEIDKSKKIDDEVYDYNGDNATASCSQSGAPATELDTFIADSCFGMCGLSCRCWIHICGDCCIHTGCKRHDEFCRGKHGVLSLDCITARGVFWDTTSDTMFDC